MYSVASLWLHFCDQQKSKCWCVLEVFGSRDFVGIWLCFFFVTCEQATKSNGSWLSVTCGRCLLILEAEKEEQHLFVGQQGSLVKYVIYPCWVIDVEVCSNFWRGNLPPLLVASVVALFVPVLASWKLFDYQFGILWLHLMYNFILKVLHGVKSIEIAAKKRKPVCCLFYSEENIKRNLSWWLAHQSFFGKVDLCGNAALLFKLRYYLATCTLFLSLKN